MNIVEIILMWVILKVKKYLQYFFTMVTDLCIRKGENESNNV